ncbi:MAG: hypothetical protein HY761_09955 [Candidatus Omnitrophica bacterium]|nr:hypothetical protein [Candidatus Omnitrophota bacterium]
MPFKERYCQIRVKGCKRRFIPTRWWQRVCENQECKKANKRRISRLWRKRNPEYHKEYNREYAGIYSK